MDRADEDDEAFVWYGAMGEKALVNVEVANIATTAMRITRELDVMMKMIVS